jgi:site-specific recombinase XerC
MHLYLKHCAHTKGLNAHQIELIANSSEVHLQRYVDEIIFRRNQREVIFKQYERDRPKTMELVYRNFVDRLKDLLKRTVGRQVRRSEIGGLGLASADRVWIRGSAFRQLDMTSHEISY